MGPLAGGWEFPPYTKTIHRASYAAISPRNPTNTATGKVVLITGGGSGIGLAIAKAFVEAGAKSVTILGRREHVLRDGRAQLERLGEAKVLSYKASVSDGPAVQAAFEATERESGKIDVVVANAGFLSQPSFGATADVADWWESFETNVKGTLLTFQAWMRHLGPDQPTFISLNSGAAHMLAPQHSAYCASKAGQAQLVAVLAAEHPDLRIVSMNPGVVETEMSSKAQMPLSRDDASLSADFALWLASPDANFLSGRLVWANWDVVEMQSMAHGIERNGELVIGLTGWPKSTEAPTGV